MSDKIVNTEEDLRAILNQITFAPSCVDLDWQWDVEDVYSKEIEVKEYSNMNIEQSSYHLRGWLVNTS
ncbi:MAG TPA: hypothetical protein VM577_08620, partial [Anaerovoracaceae bacterium]|nr:hypothetical protein [Anaerovoracaceae bacterium]